MFSKRECESESDSQPPAKKAAPGKGGGGGQRAEEVVNPIPRQFKTNSITLHFTQRTWEEIGPGELKYFPICQTPLILMDKFHLKMYNKFYPLCSTYEIHHPKARISNILMLQDNLTTQAGTPKSDTIYTQACYLLMFSPNRMNNWFKLGVTDDCMETQKILYLDYDPLVKQAEECTLVTQLAEVKGGYTDFEHLTVNPAKPYYTGGWDNKVEFKSGSREDTEDKRDIIVTTNYIPPINNSKFNQFSCSLRGTDPYIPIGEHTTMARNLDSISLHKYGDEITFDPTTNIDGMKLINNPLNNLTAYEGYTTTKPSELDIKDDPDDEFKLLVNYRFTYPSNNRPFFTRKDNLSTIGPVEGSKEIGHLQHKFITMPPIKKKDGSLLQQRASFQLEQTFSVTFHFPETTSDEGSAKWMLNQSNGVILRPSINKITSVRDGARPTPPNKIELPKPYPFPDYKLCITSIWGLFTFLKDNVVKKLIRDNGFCMVLGHYDANGKYIPRQPEDLPKLTYMTPDQLPSPSGIPEDKGPENFYESLLPLNDKEITYAKGTKQEQKYLMGTLFALFCQTMLYTKKGLREIKTAESNYEDMLTFSGSDIPAETNNYIQSFFAEKLTNFQTNFYGKNVCGATVVRMDMKYYKVWNYWPRLQPGDPIAQIPSVFRMDLLPNYDPTKKLCFYMQEFIDYLAKMGIQVMPKQDNLADWYSQHELNAPPPKMLKEEPDVTSKYEIFFI